MKKILLALLLCLGFTAHATTYYISTTGNDATGNGTLNNPWKTLYKATSTVNMMGDIIHVVAGVYTETQQCELATGVSIEGDGITSVIKSTITTSFVGVLKLYSPEEGANGNQSVSYLKFDGNNRATPRGIDIEGRSNVTIHHCTIVDFKEEGAIFNGKNVFLNELPPSIYATGNAFHDNVVTNCSQFIGYGTGCLNIGGQTGMLIYNNTITQLQRPNGEDQIGWPIKYYAGGWLKGIKIYNNSLIKAPWNGEGWNFAAELFNQQGMEIYGNTIQGSLDFNYQTKGDYAYSVYIHDNIITDPAYNPKTESGVIIEYGFEGFWIENNIFRNLSTGVSFYTRANAVLKDFRCSKNLFENIATSSDGVGFFLGGLGVGTNDYSIDGFKVLNNTFIGVATNKPGAGINLGDMNNGYLKNVAIRNNHFENVIVSCVKTGGSVVPDNFNFSYNNVINCDQYGTNNNLPIHTVVPTNYTLTNNIHVNPLFISGNTYSLQASSPLIDAGIDAGLAYNGTAPDIGYSESIVLSNFSEEPAHHAVSVYPNPSTHIVTVNLNNKQATSMEVYDVLGKLVLTQKITGDEITLSLVELPNGIYTLKVNLESGAVVKKIIKE
jgi:Secretion system C-terminal sorting domain